MKCYKFCNLKRNVTRFSTIGEDDEFSKGLAHNNLWLMAFGVIGAIVLGVVILCTTLKVLKAKRGKNI